MKKALGAALILIVLAGCETLYGWRIHAPGLLSAEFAEEIPKNNTRMGLYIPEGMVDTLSKDKGNWHSDPQTYYIGEAYVPMLIEAFNTSFEEFVLIETEPTPEIMMRYGIEYLAVVEITGFKNRKNLKGQGLDVLTQTSLFKQDLSFLAKFETHGASEAPRIFAKKGGPEVNLNHAIESNLRSIITYIQDYLQA